MKGLGSPQNLSVSSIGRRREGLEVTGDTEAGSDGLSALSFQVRAPEVLYIILLEAGNLPHACCSPEKGGTSIFQHVRLSMPLDAQSLLGPDKIAGPPQRRCPSLLGISVEGRVSVLFRVAFFQ